MFWHFSSPGHNGFLNDVSLTFIDKTDPSDPLKRENFWRETLMTMGPYGLNIEDSVWVFHLKLALFILPIYCTLWIIGTACFSGLELRKMNLFSHYFINFNFTFLFILTSIITMVAPLLLLLFSLMLAVLFSFVICSWFYFNYCCCSCCKQYVFFCGRATQWFVVHC